MPLSRIDWARSASSVSPLGGLDVHIYSYILLGGSEVFANGDGNAGLLDQVRIYFVEKVQGG